MVHFWRRPLFTQNRPVSATANSLQGWQVDAGARAAGLVPYRIVGSQVHPRTAGHPANKSNPASALKEHRLRGGDEFLDNSIILIRDISRGAWKRATLDDMLRRNVRVYDCEQRGFLNLRSELVRTLFALARGYRSLTGVFMNYYC
eukprot:COSAG01_NODE_10267_length_2205_cov_4.059354_2_plen_146_part_00